VQTLAGTSSAVPMVVQQEQVLQATVVA